MNKIAFLMMLFSTSALATPRIQNEDVKSLANLYAAVLTTTGNISSISACITSIGSTTGLAVGQFVYDLTVPSHITVGTTIVGLPGSCAVGQVQMSANANNTATGDTVTFGGQMSQLINDTKVYVTANGLNEQLSTAITNGQLSGGGGGSIRWTETTNSPIPLVEFANLSYLFTSGAAQSLYTLIQLPSNFPGSQQVKMYVSSYTPDTSGNALMQSIATLYRNATDATNSITNQRTSTNTAITVPGTARAPFTAVLDLTDSTGKINGVSVSANDMIQVQLTRGTDTAPSDLHVMADAAIVTFH